MLFIFKQFVKFAWISDFFIEGNSWVKFKNISEKHIESVISQESKITEISFVCLCDNPLEPVVILLYHTISKHSSQLVHENFDDELLLSFADVLYDLTNITHVVNILEFRRSWQQFFRYLFEDLKCGKHNRLRIWALGSKKRVENFESSRWARSREHQRKKLSQKSKRKLVSASSRWTANWNQSCIDNFFEEKLMPIVQTAQINQLSQ